MHLSAALPIVNIQTVGKLRGFSAMVYSAKYVLQEVVFSVRKCGTFFNSMPVLAKYPSVMCRDAGQLAFNFFIRYWGRGSENEVEITHTYCVGNSHQYHHAMSLGGRSVGYYLPV